MNPTNDFPVHAPVAYPLFYRTYSRMVDGARESWQQVCQRTVSGLAELGALTEDEALLLTRMQRQVIALPSGRWLWVGGTDWIKKPENFSGGYNCTSTNVTDWRAFGLMMDLAMMGCGTGAVLEEKYISQLPPIRNRLNVTIDGELGSARPEERHDETVLAINGNRVIIQVGDSRHGWVESYQKLLELSSAGRFDSNPVEVVVDLSAVRPAGERLKGFGGMANPVKLPGLYGRCAAILNGALGRQLNSIECCLLIDEAASCVVAGNIRRCLPEDALVHTDHGLVPIKDVQVGDMVQTPLGFRRVVNKFDQGVQDVYEVDTNGPIPRATLNHRMAVLSSATGEYQWKKVQNLAQGDRLLHSTQILSGGAAPLPLDFTAERPQQSRTAKDMVIPALTPDVAWMIGYTHGNGYVSLGRNKHDKPFGSVSWSMNALSDITPAIQAKLEKVISAFGLTVSHTLINGENTAVTRCQSIRMAEYFHRYIKQPNTPLSIPSFILQGSIDVRAAYLAGLMDSDGSASNRPPHLLTTVYRDFARQVAAVLSSLGIAGRTSMTAPQKESWRVRHHVTIPAFKEEYNNLIAPHSIKGRLHQGLKMYGFTIPGPMMRETYTYSEMQGMGFQGARTVDSNYERYRAESDVEMDIPVTVKGIGSYTSVQTYDIEVEEAHCFYCDGYLTHNSAGMRQFDSTDALAAVAKDNLWQQDAEGNWRIDPERDALRMANHTRVFHQKPTLEECTEAVRKQFYSGEGAIQWAVEAIARSNVDLLNTPEKKQEFIAQYQQGKGAEYLSTLSDSPLSSDELEHRLQRYGLNPCVTADTWVHTGDGPRQVKDLIGQQHSTYVNGELFSTTAEGFFYSGTKPVLKLSTTEGHSLRLTGNHKVLKVTAQTQYAQYTEWVEAETLQPGDRILLHNHRGLQPWDGKGTKEAGWLLGNLLGDGSLTKTRRNDSALLRFWGESQEEMSEHAIALLQTAVGYERRTAAAHYHRQLKHRVVNSSGLARLAAEFGIAPGHKVITNAVEQGSYEFYQGFLQGLFDADGSVQGSQAKGISVRLAQSNLASLQAVQRMLGRLGIVATIYQERRSEGYREMPDSNREPAPYFCQAQHELVIANDNLQVFAELIGFQEPAKVAKLTEVLGQYKRRPNRERFTATVSSVAPDAVEAVYDCTVPGPARFDANGLVTHNCGEILSSQFHCNLSEVHLNQIDPHDYTTQNSAFRAAALSVAVLLNQKFLEPRYQHARELDPIVGVSFTGLFDFFVNAFGVDWLRWWEAGRPDTERGRVFKQMERDYLTRWRRVVHQAVWDYCDAHGLKRPNRCTTVQPAGSKSLLTGASPGWHPPKAQRFIRRVTFRKGDPVALACIDYGYTVVPSQSDKDDDGNLLNDPFDPRCTEWLVEIPVEVPWANLPGADAIHIERFTVAAQFDFCMQVQKHYATHNVSSTLEMREGEIDTLAGLIHNAIQNDEGYISAAILARFDDTQTFPRLPFEPIDKATYEALSAAVLERRVTDDFHAALAKYDAGELVEAGPAGCDSDKCMMPEKKR